MPDESRTARLLRSVGAFAIASTVTGPWDATLDNQAGQAAKDVRWFLSHGEVAAAIELRTLLAAAAAVVSHLAASSQGIMINSANEKTLK